MLILNSPGSRMDFPSWFTISSISSEIVKLTVLVSPASRWILWNPSTRYSEGALRPVGGFDEEPRVRVAGEIVPVSERQAVIERVAAREQAVADSLARVSEEAERAAAEAAAAEARGVVLPPDTISGSRVPPSQLDGAN